MAIKFLNFETTTCTNVHIKYDIIPSKESDILRIWDRSKECGGATVSNYANEVITKLKLNNVSIPPVVVFHNEDGEWNEIVLQDGEVLEIVSIEPGRLHVGDDVSLTALLSILPDMTCNE